MHLLRYVHIVCLCALVVAALQRPAHGWGPEGHRITGEVAAAFLKDETKAAIEEILGRNSLADVANWADEIRDFEEFRWAAPLHYVNVPRSATRVNMGRDCENKMCVVGAIQKYEQELRDPATTPDKRRDALRFLVHFIGDVHQPMHVSYSDDLGGNRIDVTLFGEPTNLHRAWDTGLIRARMRSDSPRELAQEIQASITEQLQSRWSASLDPVQWANESLHITRRIYAELPRGGALGQEYYEHNISDVLVRLAMAGVRIAALLNDIYAQEPDPEVDAAEQEKQTEAMAAKRAATIVEGEACGTEDGRTIHLINVHESRVLEVRVKRIWQDRDREMSVEEVIVVRPGDADKRRLGCSRQRAGRDVREFRWEVVSVRFR